MLLTLPLLGITTTVGMVLAILQAATSVQEQSLTVLPKLVIVVVLVTYGGTWGFALLRQLVLEAISTNPSHRGG